MSTNTLTNLRSMTGAEPRPIPFAASPAVGSGQAAGHREFDAGERVVEGLEKVRRGPVAANDFQDFLDDQQVREATEPRPGDNAEAAEVRREYREAYQKTEDAREWAQDMAEEYGPGEHELPDGTVIVVRENPDGSMSVTQRNPDGSRQSVKFDEDDPTQVSLFERDAEGNETTWTRDGTRVTVERRGEENSADVYSIETGEPSLIGPLGTAPNPDAGNPKRTHFEGDLVTTTEANEDGSSDRRVMDMLTLEMHDSHTPPQEFVWGPSRPIPERT